jgi:hypothetical protein
MVTAALLLSELAVRHFWSLLPGLISFAVPAGLVVVVVMELELGIEEDEVGLGTIFQTWLLLLSVHFHI